MDLEVTKRNNLYIYPKNNFEVMIGNEGRISCKGSCCNIKLSMDDYKMQSNMYILPFEGCDIVFGIQWLMILGLDLSNFHEL